MLSGKTFMITGATGRLGYEATIRLEELGANILPVVLQGYPFRPKRVKWSAITSPIIITSSDDLKGLQSPDFVINFHWVVDRTLPAATQLFYEIKKNVHLPHFLWEWLLGEPLEGFVNISSIKVFSHLNQNAISAETEPRPITPYGIAKLTAEKYFDAHLSDSPCRVSHLRLCSVASYGEHPSHLMSQLYYSAFDNRRIKINKGVVSIIYIEDVIDLIINAALVGKKNRYLIAPPCEGIYQIARVFEEVTGRTLNADYNDLPRNIPKPVYISDIKDLASSWTRARSIEGMIKRFVQLHHRLGP
jgi:nucleoside-diphosphate-sugar epimerase